jgi:membrane-associated phospholipid phosphatase
VKQWPRACLIFMCASIVVLAAAAEAAGRDEIRAAGDVLQVAMPASAAAGSLLRGDLEGLGEFSKSAGLTIAVTGILKYAIDAHRPTEGGHSFPSGHTSISFCSAEFLRRRYGWCWGTPAYALACFVGYSRVESHQHYGRDVAAGALIGIASSYFLAHPLERASVEVSARDSGCAVALMYRW